MDFGGIFDAKEARAHEELGYRFFGCGDFLSIFAEMMRVGRATTSADVGSFIITPSGRHPLVVAREATVIQEEIGNRLVLAVGRGARTSGLMGRKQIPLDETNDFVLALRSLFQGEGIHWDGHDVPSYENLTPTPVFLSAYGPKVRKMAGATADGVVLVGGSSLELVRSYLADVAEGARSVDRQPSDVRVWMICRASVRETRAEALDDVRGLLAASAYRHLASPSQIETVPPELREPLAEFRRQYDPTGFEGYQPSWDGPNARLIRGTDLEQNLAERFAIVGTPDECRSQVEGLRQAGVERIVFTFGTRDEDTLYRRLAEALISG